MVSTGYFGIQDYEIQLPRSVNGANPLSNGRIVRNYDISSMDCFGYSQNSLRQYLTEKYIKKALHTNPQIRQILAENGIPANINMENLRQIQANHAADTQEIAKGIIRHLPQSERYKISAAAVNQASYLHDIGKVFIPNEILNKPDMLESYEREIMKAHSDLGYELLKDSALDDKTKELVRYHHQNPLGNGYPASNLDFHGDLNLQILSAADKYSALTENRAYKAALTPNTALGIIYADVQKNQIDPVVFQGLAGYLRGKSLSR